MFNRFLKALSADRPVPPVINGHLALAALMVRLARSDGHYAEAEVSGIDHILATRLGLSESDAQDLRARAEAFEASAADSVRFTRALKASVAFEERIDVIQMLWEIVLADGKRDVHEDQQMRLCADLLGVSDRDSALARQRAGAQ